jgi:preprotein translocase subunit SecD
MSKRIRNRSIVIVLVTLLSIFLIAGFPPTLQGVKDRVRLGLDLRGGTQLVLEVITDDAIRSTTDQTIQSLQEQLQKDQIIVRQMVRTQVDQFQAVGVDPSKDNEFRNIISGVYLDWDIISSQGDVPNTYTLRMKPRAVDLYREQAVEQGIRTIENRVNQMGVVEPVIQRRTGTGKYEILVQFPGVDNPESVKKIIGTPAVLELRLVYGMSTYPTREAALQQFGGAPPPGLEVMEAQERAPDGSRVFYVINSRVGITGRQLKSASVSRDQNNRPAVAFNLNAEGAAQFGRLTGENVGKLLAIILDRQVVSAPIIESRITDNGIINGGNAGFSPEAAADLVLVLKSGALPAKMEYLEETVVGASLGADSIRSGILASIAALAGVVLFVLFYYRGSGVNATLAMVLNLLILLGTMVALGATLTLPGIAGVILTIGVGIDSNILVFERIREELRAGKTAVSAVNTSFQRVFITLVDTHLAALISATFLFIFGTGAVQGFAVTLVLGLIANMFTAVFVSRTLFEMILSRREREQALSI